MKIATLLAAGVLLATGLEAQCRHHGHSYRAYHSPYRAYHSPFRSFRSHHHGRVSDRHYGRLLFLRRAYRPAPEPKPRMYPEQHTIRAQPGAVLPRTNRAATEAVWVPGIRTRRSGGGVAPKRVVV